MTMQRDSSSTAVATALAFLSGIAVGLLFAKQSGTETREQISDLLSQGKKKGEDLISSMSDEGGKEPSYEPGKYT